MTNDLVTQFTVKDTTIKITYNHDWIDTQAILDHDYPIYLYTWHRRYSIGTPNPFSTRDEMFAYILNLTKNTVCKLTSKQLSNRLVKECVILPVYMLDHTNITLSTNPFNDPWDSGLLGYIFVLNEDIRKSLNIKKVTSKVRTEVENVLKLKVNTISDIADGNIFDVLVCDNNDNVIDSCGQFIGGNWSTNGIVDYIAQHINMSIGDLTNILNTSCETA